MTVYYILDPATNTWSEEAYPLNSILSIPGICGEHVLSDAHTGQTLTVSQAHALSTAAAAAPAPRPVAPAMPKGPNKTLTQGMSLNRDKAKSPNQISISSLQKKPSREYRVLSQSDPRFNGMFSPQLLTQELNNMATRGWRVISMTTAPLYAADGSIINELMVLLERNG